MRDYLLRRFEHGELTVLVRQYGQAVPGRPTRAFLLVHGIGASSRYFARLSRELTPHGIVYAVDLPGFGSAPTSDAPLGISDLASLLRTFAAAWGIVDPVLVGHSMGAQVVLEMAVQDPSLPASVVLLAPVVDPKSPTALGQALRLLRDVFTEPPSANWIVAGDYLRCGPGRYLSALPSMLVYPIEERAPRLRAPTIVVRGSRDPVSPGDWADRVAGVIPDASRLDVPGASHVVQHSAAPVVAAAILSHVEAAVPQAKPEQER